MTTIGEISAVDPFSMSTFEGHAWRLRDDDGEVLLEATVIFGASEMFIINVKPCILALEVEELEALKPAFDSASACPELSDVSSCVSCECELNS